MSICLSLVNLFIKSFWTIFDKLISLLPARKSLLLSSQEIIKPLICSKEGDAVVISFADKEFSSVLSESMIFDLSIVFCLSFWFKSTLEASLSLFINDDLSIIALSATEATISKGILLLSFYSLGLAIPFILSGYYMSRFLNTKKGFGKYYGTITKTGGAILLVTGILITTNYIQVISYYILTNFPILAKLG